MGKNRNQQNHQEKNTQNKGTMYEYYEQTKESGQTGKKKNGIQSCWNDRIMERFIKANLFVICCVAAGLLLIVYLGAFSCEVSWILEAHGDLPFAAYILCTQFFVVFVATTILIHGLVTGLQWGLFAWSVVIGLLSIPELIFVMMMTTQHWGLQSVHGLTELITYLVRLVINCLTLICVIPTGLRWRRETQVLSQLQDLATRLQLQTPPPSAPITKADSRRSSQRLHNHMGIENAGFQVSEATKLQMIGSQSQGLNMLHGGNNNNSVFGSQNEFNASIFASPYMQQQNQHISNGAPGRNGNRAQSLMDLRCTLPGLYNPRYFLDSDDKNGKYFNITLDDLKNNLHDSNKNQTPSLIGSVNDPIYCSIEPKAASPPQQRQRQQRSTSRVAMGVSSVAGPPHKVPAKFTRNCISLENLDGIARVQDELAAHAHGQNALMQNYTAQQQYYLAMLSGYLQGSPIAGGQAFTVLPQPLQRHNSQLQYYGGYDYANYTNPYITANSKLSLGNESDDYRKYRDVAL